MYKEKYMSTEYSKGNKTIPGKVATRTKEHGMTKEEVEGPNSS